MLKKMVQWTALGNEAIAQLIIELENHSTDKLIIFAGYGGMLTKKITECRHFLILIRA